jgi:hypothetical protein
MRTTRVRAAVVLSIFAAALACDDATDLDDAPNAGDPFFTADLSTARVVGPITLPTGARPASGVITIVMADAIMTVIITITDDLTSGITGAWLEGPASAEVNADKIFDFGPAMTAAVATGARTGRILTMQYDLANTTVNSARELRIPRDDLINILNAGLAFLTITTVANPNGELRGQLVRTN